MTTSATSGYFPNETLGKRDCLRKRGALVVLVVVACMSLCGVCHDFVWDKLDNQTQLF